MIPSEHPSNHTPDPAGPKPVTRIPLALPESKQMLVEFLLDELRAAVAKASEAVTLLADRGDRLSAGAILTEVGETTARIARFFEFDVMLTLCRTIARLGAQSGRVIDDDVVLLAPRAAALVDLLREQAEGLSSGVVISRPVSQLCEEIAAILDGRPVAASPASISPASALVETTPSETAPVAASTSRSTPLPTESMPTHNARPSRLVLPPAAIHAPAASPAVAHFAAPADAPVLHAFDERAALPTAPKSAPVETRPVPLAARTPAVAEEPKRFPADTLDSILALVGDLAMQRNRLVALAGEAGGDTSHLRALAGSVSRIAGELRDQVASARRQPVSVLASRLAAACAQAARETNKDVDFTAEGVDVETDFTLLDRLHEPLVEIVRTLIAARRIGGTTIALRAAQAGDELTLELSSPANTTDLSRPFGELRALGAWVDFFTGNTENPVTTTLVRISESRFITAALFVEIGLETFALPVADIDGVYSLSQTRDDLQILDARELFNLAGPSPAPESPVVVVKRAGRSVGLRVGRSLGIRDIVVRPLDPVFATRGPVCGATLREDGGIALVADAPRIAELALDRSRPPINRAA